MEENLKPQKWWQTVPGVLTATAAIITAVTGLIIALHQGRVFDTAPTPAPHAQINDSKSPATPKTPTVPGGASDAAMPSATDQAIQMPDGHAVTISFNGYKFQYTILSAQRKRLPPDKYLLRFRIHVWTDFIGGMLFVSDSFRLNAGDLRIKPANNLVEAVSRDETKEGDIEFEVDGSIKEAILVITMSGFNFSGNTRQLRLAFL